LIQVDKPQRAGAVSLNAPERRYGARKFKPKPGAFRLQN